jgi:hypothetical protein
MSDDLNNDVPETMFDIKMPGTDEVVQVTASQKKLIDSMVSIARKDAKGKAEKQFAPVKELLAKYESENGVMSEELEAIKESQMSEVEKAQNQFKKELAKLQETTQEAISQAETWQAKFKENKVQNDIYSAFGDYKLSNPEHAAILFKNSVETSIEPVLDSEGNSTDQYQTKMKMIVSDGNGGYKELEGGPKELFKSWIEQDSNKHLLINNLNPGAGSSHGGNMEGMSDVDKLRAQYEEAKKSGDGVKMMHLKTKINNMVAASG